MADNMASNMFKDSLKIDSKSWYVLDLEVKQ